MNRADRRLQAKWDRRMDKWNARPPAIVAGGYFHIDDYVHTRFLVEKIEEAPRKIYRIEHPESERGPFTHYTATNHGLSSSAMSLMMEPSVQNPSAWHYAFDSVKNLYRNIANMIVLKQCGFHLRIYESNRHVVMHDGQVAFDKDRAICLRSDPIHQFPFEEYF